MKIFAFNNAQHARLKRLAREIVPPLAIKSLWRLKQRLKGHSVEWELLPGGFEQARRDAKIKGWNEPLIGEVYARDLKETRAHLQADIPFGLTDLNAPADCNALFNHNLALTWGWVLGRVAERKSQLSILDWGGALGHYCVWARALRPDLTLDYTVKEMPVIAELGAQTTPEARFVSDAAQALARQYDLVVASVSLHYEEDWRALLPRLLGASRQFVFLNRIPLTDDAPFVYVQRPYAYGYNTEYPSWCFNRAQFISHVEACGWQIEQEIVTGEVVAIAGVPEPVTYRGFLLRPREE